MTSSFRARGFVWRLLPICLAPLTGCASFSGPVPFLFAEGPATLPRGGVRIDIAGGGGGGSLGGKGGGGGGAGRVRVSLGRAGEIGGSAYAIGGKGEWVETSAYLAAKADYKLSLIEQRLAVVGGVGGGKTDDHGFWGADLGLLTGYQAWYLGVRGGFSLPVETPKGPRTGHLIFATGVRDEIASRIFWFFEVGAGPLFVPDNAAGGAGYGAVGISFEL